MTVTHLLLILRLLCGGGATLLLLLLSLVSTGHADLAEKLADAVPQDATPVGSGITARTERIPIRDRGEAAVIAWMRHRTTAYDETIILRIRGKSSKLRRRSRHHI